MPTDRVKAAVEELTAALTEEGMDAGTVDAQLKYILPPEHDVRGNYADLQRMGAIAVTGTMPTPPGNDDIDTGDVADAFTGENPATDQTADLSSMTKAELEDEAAKRGVDVPSGSTKADIVAALGG